MLTACLLFCSVLQAPAPLAKVMLCRGSIALVRDGKNLGQLPLLHELRDKDQLHLEPGAGLILDFRGGFRESVGVKDKLAAKTILTVGAAGCEPKAAVTHVMLKTYAGQFTNLRGLPQGSAAGKAAGAVFRDKNLPNRPPAVVPMYGCTVLRTRPDFSWQKRAGAMGYLLELQNQAGEKLWSMRAQEPRLPFPAEKPELDLGNVYRWQVFALLAGNKEELLWDSLLHVANASEKKRCADWLAVIAEGNQADLLQAAALFQKVGAYQESQRVYEELLKRAPDEPFFLAALADHYERGGRLEEAEKLLARAKKLGYK